jgi:hypothetical protein
VATPGEVTGYAVGRPGDANASGGQVWFGGSKLAPDLALPKLNARWREVAPPRALAPGVVAAETMPGVPRPRGLLSLEERAAILGRAARALERAAVDVAYAAAPEDPQAVGGDRAVGGNGAAAQGSPSATPAWAGEAVSAAEVATAFARAVEGDGGGPLTRAGDAMARAARLPGGARPDMSRRVHALRDVAAGLGLLGAALPDEAGAILTITAHLARIVDGIASARAAATPAGGRDPQARAGRRAVAAYAEHAGPVPAAQADRVRAALGGQLGRLVTADAGWPALAAALRRVDACGGDSIAVLVQASTSRKLDSARSAAAVLHYRVNLGAARAHQGTSQGPGPATASSPMLPGHSTEFHRPRGR